MALGLKTDKYGLSQEDIDGICSVFSHHGNVERAILYGSRAKGNYRPNSDIDLALEGSNLTLKTVLRIELEIDDLLLPYKVDLAVLHNIENRQLLDHIERVGVVFYSKE